jgi:hypothetical protein
MFDSTEEIMTERFTVQEINSVMPDAVTGLVHIRGQTDDQASQLDVCA